ncbi:hypothetical protein FHG87_020331 [Trinorchestia longiramus]|nr:hypothetical protein FHG87_020331 [Trinorchestia longiramus]
MEAKRIENSALLRASHKKSDIAKRLNVSRMTVHRVASRLRDGETLKDRPRSGFWPPQSPVLNPLDYSVWTHIESKACKVRHKSVEELKSSINRSWATMRKEYIRKVCKDFHPRQSRVITAEGDQIENSFVIILIKCFSKWSVQPPGGVEEMQGGGRRVRLEWGAHITV